MESRYVDNLSTAIQAVYDALSEHLTANDEAFKLPHPDPEIEWERQMVCMTNEIISQAWSRHTGHVPFVLTLAVDHQNKFIPSFPLSATREQIVWVLTNAIRIFETIPIGQAEERAIRG